MPLASELLMPGRRLKLDYKMLRHGENSLQNRLGHVQQFASFSPHLVSWVCICIIDLPVVNHPLL